MKCSICPRKCGAVRLDDTNTGGYCGAGYLPRVARAGLHFFEEPPVSGKNGSGTVFFSGCSLGCVYCQNEIISHRRFGKTVSVNRLAEIFRELVTAGAENINLVTPTHYSYAVMQALRIYRPPVPVIYNSSGYELPEVLSTLENYIDVYLLDFKYISAGLSERYSAAPDYPEYAKAALLEAYRQKGACVFENGIIKSGVIVRHLLLPSATWEAIKIFDYVSRNAPGAYFSIMNQYVPVGRALDTPPIDRKVTKREYEKVLDHIIESGFDNCWFQDSGAADTSFIPDFDLSGV